ncbi:hypothetical protein WJX75_004819 [Coccomyxa subellipsoidea]|uniref:Uncharacterized protein n=1 Tax=Coccomyxa subellipsoidea TaxID=248742 RepID=A0ABR2Z2W7_9CHLO
MCYAGGGHTHVEAFRQQFEADAEHFLRLRAAEFGPGGLLLIVAPGMLGDWYNGRGLMSSVADAAIELSAQGKINTALVEDFVWPIYFPTEDELVSAANRAGNWEVVQRGCTPLAHMWDAYQESEDSDTYAKTLISIMCGVGGPLLCERLAISEDTLQASTVV